MNTYTIWTLLLLPHLLADFVFPRGHEQGEPATAGPSMVRDLTAHCLTHFLLSLATLTLFSGGTISLASVLWPIFLLTAAHLGTDLGSIWLDRRKRPPQRLVSLLLDQGVHLAVLTAVSAWIAEEPPRRLISVLADRFLRQSPVIGTVAVVFIAVVFAGGRLLALLLEPFAAQIRAREQDGEQDAETADQLARAGRWIGWLERTLILAAITLGSPAGAGLIVAAKSVFRFSEARDRPFAEYFLIGTLLSVVLAVAGGIVLRIVLF